MRVIDLIEVKYATDMLLRLNSIESGGERICIRLTVHDWPNEVASELFATLLIKILSELAKASH